MRHAPSLGPAFRLVVIVLATAPLFWSCGPDDDRTSGATNITSTVDTSTATSETGAEPSSDAGLHPLPPPRTDGSMSLEAAIQSRRSVRAYSDSPLSLEEVGQLMWAAQGITSAAGTRAAPSAGGTYPLEVYVVVGQVTGMNPGVYRYQRASHELAQVAQGDTRAFLAHVCLEQDWVREGAIAVIIAADYSRTTAKYGDRGVRYVQMEAGHAAQNLCLQAVALGLGSVTVGAFLDEQVTTTLHLPKEHKPLYVIPVGRPSSR